MTGWITQLGELLARLRSAFFGAPLRLYVHPTTALLPTSSRSTPDQHVRLGALLKAHCPHLTGQQAFYTPVPCLPNGHLQTIYCAITNSTKANQVRYERKTIRLPDGGQIDLDFSPPGAFDDRQSATPTLVVLHGLTGGSHESYVRALVAPVIQQLGWRVMVTNFRGCAGSKLTSSKLYHAGATDDLRCALLFLSHLVPLETPLHGLGFSLGANILAKYLGEERESSMLRTAVVLANPWDLYKGHLFLESSFIQRVYSRVLAFSLRSMAKRHLSLIRKSPVDLELLYSDPYQTLYDFDTIVTRVLGNFASTENYYRSQSSSRVIRDVRVPLLGLNAADDVIACVDSVPLDQARENPFVVLGITKRGGHLGWFEGSLFPSNRFITRPVLEWFQALNDHLDCTAPARLKREETSPVTVGAPMILDLQRPGEIGFQLVDSKSAEDMVGVAERVANQVIQDGRSIEFLKLLFWDGGRAALARKKLRETKND